MPWPKLESVDLKETIPDGYKLGVLETTEVPQIIASLKSWYPDIIVGMESCHLEPNFFLEECHLEGQIDSGGRNIIPIVLRYDGAIILFLSLERNKRSLTLTARLGVIDPAHRGAKLAYLGPGLLEAYGRALGYGLAYYTVTLKIPHQQRVAEKLGFQLVGILPAIDRDMVRPGEIKRVFEAVYAKILVPMDQVEMPSTQSLTENTAKLFNFMFPSPA